MRRRPATTLTSVLRALLAMIAVTVLVVAVFFFTTTVDDYLSESTTMSESLEGGASESDTEHPPSTTAAEAPRSATPGVDITRRMSAEPPGQPEPVIETLDAAIQNSNQPIEG